MKSLNGYSIEQVKKEISKRMDCKICDIKLFGSRINGNFHRKSDLDVAIRNEDKAGSDMTYLFVLDMKVEVRYVEDFEVSWLKNSI